MTRTAGAALVLATLALPGSLRAQATHPRSGRTIAPVMGVGGAGWLERDEREIEEQPEEALDAIGIRPGMTIADVGAGVGYFTLRLARRLSGSGKVYANEIQPGMIEKLRKNLEKENIENVETVLGTETDPKLPAGKIDLVLLVDVYHEFSQPQKMLGKIRESLTSAGRLVLLEYRKEDPTVPIRLEHKMSVEEVKREIEPEGFRLAEVLTSLPRQHILIFRKNLM